MTTDPVPIFGTQEIGPAERDLLRALPLTHDEIDRSEMWTQAHRLMDAGLAVAAVVDEPDRNGQQIILTSRGRDYLKLGWTANRRPLAETCAKAVKLGLSLRDLDIPRPGDLRDGAKQIELLDERREELLSYAETFENLARQLRCHEADGTLGLVMEVACAPHGERLVAALLKALREETTDAE